MTLTSIMRCDHDPASIKFACFLLFSMTRIATRTHAHFASLVSVNGAKIHVIRNWKRCIMVSSWLEYQGYCKEAEEKLSIEVIS